MSWSHGVLFCCSNKAIQSKVENLYFYIFFSFLFCVPISTPDSWCLKFVLWEFLTAQVLEKCIILTTLPLCHTLWNSVCKKKVITPKLLTRYSYKKFIRSTSLFFLYCTLVIFFQPRIYKHSDIYVFGRQGSVYISSFVVWSWCESQDKQQGECGV